MFAELKLSEILLSDIDTYKAEIMKLQELHQEDQDEIQMLSKEIKEQKRIINKIKLQYKQQGHTLKESIIEMNEVNG